MSLYSQTITYRVCGNVNETVDLYLNEIQQDIYNELLGDLEDETVYVSIAKNGVGKITNPSTSPVFEVVCARSNAIDSYFEIAVDRSQDIFVCNRQEIFKINEDCTEETIATLPEESKFAMSFDSQNNLYVGGSHPRVYRANADDLNSFSVWHEFDEGHPAGDFVVIGEFMYIAWQENNGSYIYKVSLTEDNQYISHTVLGAIPTNTYGMAAEYGKLFGVTPDNLYEISLNPFGISNVINNPSSSYPNQWWGAAGMHEAINFTITFHETLADANNGNNSFTDSLYQANNGDVIYIRIENTVDGTYEIRLLEIVFYLKPIVEDVQELFCSGSEPSSVNLNDYATNISSEADATYSYFTSYQSAFTNNSPISNESNFAINNFPTSLYVRVENAECFNIAELLFDVVDSNIIIPSVIVCENQPATISAPSGYLTYEWSGLSATDLTTNDITSNTITVTSPGTYTVILELASGCTSLAEVEVIWEPLPSVSNLEATLCIDITSSISFTELLNSLNQDLSLYDVAFFLSEVDANNSTINGQTEFNLQGINEFYARISETGSDCFIVVPVSLQSDSFIFNLQDEYFICEGEILELRLGLNPSIQNLTWLGLNDVDIVLNDIHSHLVSISQEGIYSIEVNLDSGCRFTHSFTVTFLDSPVIQQIEINGDDVTIIAGGSTELLYSLDGETYQTSNIFLDLALGDYVVFVKADDLCGVTTEHFSISNFTNIITPNGDGINDYWNVPENENNENSSVQVYDRYGKLLFNYPEDALPWDGTYLNRKLPSTSYYYIINYGDGRIKKGQLTIKNK